MCVQVGFGEAYCKSEAKTKQQLDPFLSHGLTEISSEKERYRTGFPKHINSEIYI